MKYLPKESFRIAWVLGDGVRELCDHGLKPLALGATNPVHRFDVEEQERGLMKFHHEKRCVFNALYAFIL